MQGQYESMMGTMHTLFPKLTMVYWSGRIYAGYSNGVAKIDPEPYAYESSFAVKNAINDQLNGASNLCDGNGCSTDKRSLDVLGTVLLGQRPARPQRRLRLDVPGSLVQKDGTHPTTSGDFESGQPDTWASSRPTTQRRRGS